jgi:hypothetical protein
METQVEEVTIVNICSWPPLRLFETLPQKCTTSITQRKPLRTTLNDIDEPYLIWEADYLTSLYNCMPHGFTSSGQVLL